MRYLSFIFSLVCCILFTACNDPKDKMQHNIQQMQSTPIYIPYSDMACWTEDSISSIDLCKQAKLKLVHYVDSVQCTTCYLQKVAQYEKLFQLEQETNYRFVNVFVIAPGSNRKRMLLLDHKDKLLPQMLFVDTAHVFTEKNKTIPSEEIYHTFLLNENDSVILVGNPVVYPKIAEIFYSTVKGRLKIK